LTAEGGFDKFELLELEELTAVLPILLEVERFVLSDVDDDADTGEEEVEIAVLESIEGLELLEEPVVWVWDVISFECLEMGKLY
jgi:hypothetical protein